MEYCPDNPIIRNCERYGYPDGEEEVCYCPICHSENPETFYFDDFDNMIGCNLCVHKKDAYDYLRRENEYLD